MSMGQRCQHMLERWKADAALKPTSHRGDTRNKPIHLQNRGKTQVPEKAEVRGGWEAGRGCRFVWRTSNPPRALHGQKQPGNHLALASLETCLPSGEREVKDSGPGHHRGEAGKTSVNQDNEVILVTFQAPPLPGSLTTGSQARPNQQAACRWTLLWDTGIPDVSIWRCRVSELPSLTLAASSTRPSLVREIDRRAELGGLSPH